MSCSRNILANMATQAHELGDATAALELATAAT